MSEAGVSLHFQPDIPNLSLRGKVFPPAVFFKNEQNNIFSLNAVSFCSLLHQTQLLYLTNAAKVQKLLTSIISVNSLPSSEAVALNLTPPLLLWKINYPAREPFMCEVYHGAEVQDSFISLGGHYWKRVTVVRDFHHLSNQPPIRAEILGAQRKLVIVISHLSTRRCWERFSGMFYESRENKGPFVCFGGQLELWDGCQVMVPLQCFFQPTSLVFTLLVDKSGREAQLCNLWSHPWATLWTFSRSVPWCRASYQGRF